MEGKYSSVLGRRGRSSSKEVKDISTVQTQTYYMKNLEYQLKFESQSEYSTRVKKHLEETFRAIKLIQGVRKSSDETVNKSQYRCIPNEAGRGVSKSRLRLRLESFTLVFDLDETLTHLSENTKSADAILPIHLPDGSTVKVEDVHPVRTSLPAFLQGPSSQV